MDMGLGGVLDVLVLFCSSTSKQFCYMHVNTFTVSQFGS